MRWALAAALLLLAGSRAGAEDAPTYKCAYKGGVVYSQVPCNGAEQLNAPRKRVNVRYESPPQDRATLARRSRLTEEARQECVALDKRLPEQELELKAKGDALTLQDEMPLVFNKKKYRELGC
jgi:hypothetical protein